MITLCFREEIGVLTSLPLLRNVVEDLEEARNSGEPALRLYFTKESHMHTLVNLVLYSGIPIANRLIPELDYCVSEFIYFSSPSLSNVALIVTYNVKIINAFISAFVNVLFSTQL